MALSFKLINLTDVDDKLLKEIAATMHAKHKLCYG